MGPRGVPSRSVAALELEAEAWRKERGKFRRKVTYGHKQMLNLLYNNQLSPTFEFFLVKASQLIQGDLWSQTDAKRII